MPKMSRRVRAGLSCESLNGELFVLGDSGFVGFFEKFNFKTQKWTVLGNIKYRNYLLVTCVFETKILAIPGHEELEVYDESQHSWTMCKRLGVSRHGHAAVVVSGRDLGKEVLRIFQHPLRDEN